MHMPESGFGLMPTTSTYDQADKLFDALYVNPNIDEQASDVLVLEHIFDPVVASSLAILD